MFQGQFLMVKYLGHNIDRKVTNEWMKLKAMVQYPPVVVLGLAKQSNSHDYNKPCLASVRGQKTLHVNLQ